MTRRRPLTRRQAAAAGASLLASTSLLEGQKLIGEPPGRITPIQDLVNTFEFEAMAQRKLNSSDFAEIAGSDRAAFDRITFRPRLMIDATRLDLTAEVFGQRLFAPIIVGPTSQQKRFHPEGELAMVRGASAARTVMVVSELSSFPLEEIAAQAKTTLWYQLYPEPDIDAVRRRAQQHVNAGCKAVCVTIAPGGGSTPPPLAAGIDWSAIDRLRKAINVPLLVKGIMSPEEAQRAVSIGVQGIVVSSYTRQAITGTASSLEVLPSIADAVSGKIGILIDGSFRRGTDILKALALGAQAVLLGRPTLWGLAAYGADGVQKLLEMLQTELARDMAMCGAINMKSMGRNMVKVHGR